MADTPRGPRPTVSRRTATLLVAGWLVVLALLTAAAVIPMHVHELGWHRVRLPIVDLPYGNCDDGCTITPTVELPNGDTHKQRLRIEADEELLPSAHFRTGGSLLLWQHAGEQQLRAREPVATSARAWSIGLLIAAIALAAGTTLLAYRSKKLHADGRAGQVFDHLAVRALPAFVVVSAIVLATWYSHHMTRRYDPILPSTAGDSKQGP